MRLKLTIAYDGRPFNGWQAQACGNTVQDHLHKALEQTAKQPVKLQGSGRTDTGVHALAQVAHFDAPEDISMNPFNWVPALNTKLPATIRVMSCEETDDDFHARFSAKGKIYHYDIATDPVLPPLKAGLAWHLPKLLHHVSKERRWRRLLASTIKVGLIAVRIHGSWLGVQKGCDFGQKMKLWAQAAKSRVPHKIMHFFSLFSSTHSTTH